MAVPLRQGEGGGIALAIKKKKTFLGDFFKIFKKIMTASKLEGRYSNGLNGTAIKKIAFFAASLQVLDNFRSLLHMYNNALQCYGN